MKFSRFCPELALFFAFGTFGVYGQSVIVFLIALAPTQTSIAALQRLYR